MTREKLPPQDPATSEPAMELLDGEASATTAHGPSWFFKLARGTAYGVVILGATALLAVSAVPELARYATFLPEQGASCNAATGGSCTTLDKVSFDSPCCSNAAMAVATVEESSSCCPFSSADNAEAVLASAEGVSSCCTKASESVVALTSADAPAACCLSGASCSAGDGCPQAVAADEPIDAGSLFAAAPQEDAGE